jgi:hypothetical protein
MKLHTACMPRVLDMAFTLPKCPQLSAIRRHHGAGRAPREDRDIDMGKWIHTPAGPPAPRRSAHEHRARPA